MFFLANRKTSGPTELIQSGFWSGRRAFAERLVRWHNTVTDNLPYTSDRVV